MKPARRRQLFASVFSGSFCECGCGAETALDDKGKPRRFAAGHVSWKGGRKMHEGYVLILVGRGHEMADSKGYVREHRLVMSRALGRPLGPEEVVHHLNRVKDDNRIENLFLCASAGEHNSCHANVPVASQSKGA